MLVHFLLSLLIYHIVNANDGRCDTPSPSSPSSSTTAMIDRDWEEQLQSGKILVLGSGGLVGRSLTKWLVDEGYQVLTVANRSDLDLRIPSSLNKFQDEKISMCVFLACEVGGSKFIGSGDRSTQVDIIQHNLDIYHSVLPFLAKNKIPFIFTSSYLQYQTNSYGSIKRLGETWIKALGIGKIVRLWNIFGFEPIGRKSHVLSDWVSSCVNTGQFQGQTDGAEPRQFLHTEDCASGIGWLIRHYPQADVLTDLSSNRWVTIREAAQLVSKLAPRSCTYSLANISAESRDVLDPITSSRLYNEWSPKLSLVEGISRLFTEYEATLL